MNRAKTILRKRGACLALLLLPLVPAEASQVDWRADPWFHVGEKLTYKVHWGIIPVGTSVASTDWVEHEGRRLIAIRFRTRSNKVLRTLYPVDDLIEAWIDPGTFLPVVFRKKLKEGRYRCDEETWFDFEKGVARWTSHIRDRTKEYPIHENTRDLVTFLYYIRGQSRHFQPGEREEFQVMADEKLYDLFVEPLKEEKVKLSSFGKVPSVVFQPEAAFEGIFVRKGKVTLWSSNDDRRILTRIKARVPFASVRITLDKVAGPGDDFWVKKDRKKKKRDPAEDPAVSSGGPADTPIETAQAAEEETHDD